MSWGTGDILYIVLLGVVVVFAMDMLHLWGDLADWLNELLRINRKQPPLEDKCRACRNSLHSFCISKGKVSRRECPCRVCNPKGAKRIR